MRTNPTNFLTATETRTLLTANKVSLQEVLSDHVDRYEERDGQIGAWVHVNHAPVMKASGPLSGVILGVKDVIDTKDLPTENGCEMYRGARTDVDASVVGICRAAGAIIIGKSTNDQTTTMFAASMVGPPKTNNPMGVGHTPGGSSSGSAAAVSDYQCHIAVGTQTGGSTIRPASFTGIFGFKPKHDRVCRDGVKSFAGTFDTIGFFARSITDIQLISRQFDIISTFPSNPYTKPIDQCHFGFVKTDQFDSHVTADLKRIWAHAHCLLRQAGANVEEVDLPSDFDNLVGGEGALMPNLTLAEGYTNLLRDYRTDQTKLEPAILDWFKHKRRHSAQEIPGMYDRLAALRPKFDQLAREYDAIITPSVPGEAPEGLTYTGDGRFCTIWTGLHVPAINIPGFAGSNGLPIGLTLVTARHEDERLLQVAKLVAEVFIGADEGKLNKVPAPAGTIHVQV